MIQLAMRIFRGGLRHFRKRPEGLPADPNKFLNDVKGVIHVGANSGQEREAYAASGLDVVWIEPIPDIFRQLQVNLKPFPRQLAFQYLVTDQDDQNYVFHIANNGGQSSSILPLGLHERLWPDVSYTAAITLRSMKLSSLLKKERLDPNSYDALVIDTQGSELLVLTGAIELLPHFRFIKTEVADFESYRGCCTFHDIDDFLKQFGFRLFIKHKFASADGVGSYFDVVYRNEVH